MTTGKKQKNGTCKRISKNELIEKKKMSQKNIKKDRKIVDWLFVAIVSLIPGINIIIWWFAWQSAHDKDYQGGAFWDVLFYQKKGKTKDENRF